MIILLDHWSTLDVHMDPVGCAPKGASENMSRASVIMVWLVHVVASVIFYINIAVTKSIMI